MTAAAAPSLTERARRLVDAPAFQRVIVSLIVLNAISLGLETSPEILARFGDALHAFDRAVLLVFVAEVSLRLFAYRLSFFRNAWSVFDFVIVGVALLPHAGAFAVLRALRVLRVLRLVSAVPSMRRVVSALLAALPGMASIAALLALLLYVFAVMATKLFAGAAPEYFGSLGASLFTLFQVMTMEGWADIARGLMATSPWAWLFFVVYILVSTFTVLNLFIAVVVNAMQEQIVADMKEDEKEHAAEARIDHAELVAELRGLREEVAAMRRSLARPGA